MNRRDFLTGIIASALPPAPPKHRPRLYSPKDLEQRSGFRKMAIAVSAQNAPAVSGFTVALMRKPEDQFELSWTGGKPAYQIQQAVRINGRWTNIGNPTLATNRFLANSSGMGFFRVQQSVVMALSYTLDDSGVHLTWNAPESG